VETLRLLKCGEFSRPLYPEKADKGTDGKKKKKKVDAYVRAERKELLISIREGRMGSQADTVQEQRFPL